MKNRKVAAVLVVSIILTSFFTYVLAASPTNTMTFSGGAQQPENYFVFEDGGNYFAKDELGNIDYTGAVAETVINNALSGGGCVQLASDTEFPLTAAVTITESFTRLEGLGNTNLTTAADITVISVDISDNIEGVYIGNLYIQGADLGTTNAGIYAESMWYSTIENVHIQDLYYGVRFYGPSAAYSGGHNNVVNVEIESCNYGWYQSRGYSSVARHVSSHNNVYGYFLTDHAQGLEMDSCFGSFNSNTGLYVIGTETGYIHNCQFASNNYGIRMRDGTWEFKLIDVYVEASTYQNIVIEAGSSTGTKYNSGSITIAFSDSVKAEREGIKITGYNGYNVTDVYIDHCNIQNNGNETSNTYWGIYSGDDGSSYNNGLWIINCNVGNSAEWQNNEYQRGIATGSNSVYTEVLHCDTRTAVATTAVPIYLVDLGTTDHINLSYNGTSWIDAA